MLKIILNTLQPQAKEIIAEEQASKYSISGSSAKTICSLNRISMRSSYISRRLLTEYDTTPYEQLSANTTSIPTLCKSLEICMTRPRTQSCSMAAHDWDRTAVGVQQGCLLSPTFCNVYLKRMTCETLDDHEGCVSIKGLLITKFRFADAMVVNAGEEEEANVLS